MSQIIRYGIFSSTVTPTPLPTPPVSGVTAWYGDLVNGGTDRTTLSNGASITQWDDQSGNDYHLDSVSGTPTYDATNNLLDFTAGTLYNLTHEPISGSSDRTIISVYETITGGNERVLTFGDVTLGGYLGVQNISTSTFQYGIDGGYQRFNQSIGTNNKILNVAGNNGTLVTNSFARNNGIDLTKSTPSSGTIDTTGGGIMTAGYINNGVVFPNNDIKLYEVIIYDRVLSISEIEQVEAYLGEKYFNTRPVESTRISLDALVQQTGNNTFQFNTNTNQAFTIAQWVKIGSGNTQSYLYTSGRETASSNRHHQIYPFTSTDSVAFLTQTGGSPNVWGMTGYTTPVAEKWYFITASATLDDGTGSPEKKVFLYDEAGFIASGSTNVYNGINVNSNFKFIINAVRLNNYSNHEGVYSAFGVWNRALTDAEIAELYNDGAGKQYASLSTGLKTDMAEWFDFGDWDGSNVTGKHVSTVMVKGGSGTISNETT